MALFTRMLFSCLVDADRTMTEAFCNPEAAAERGLPKPDLRDLLAALNAHLDRIQANRDRSTGSPAADAVNTLRKEVRAACEASAELPPGFFSLTVPTGGGKTFASLAFALRHAVRHDLRRAIVAIPYTSIIEQTAQQYRNALGALADRGLLEHHSNVEPNAITRASRQAAENWDVPIVVTTNVQLLESLFAAATSPCRKIHRIARSVIIFDEVQSLPLEVLQPTMMALQALVDHFGCSIVLCTATQPALEHRPDFPNGFKDVRSIVRDSASLFKKLARVRVEHVGKVDDVDIAQRLAAETSVLCIVNTRRQASRIHAALRDAAGTDGSRHLSTLMCARHRRRVLDEVRARLDSGRPCRVVSTQLIEAGVDIDFPVVYRAAAGFDSIAQSAGRCNREGKLPELGRVLVFDSPTPPAVPHLRRAAEIARELREAHPDPLTPEATEAYFRLLYWSQWHRSDVMNVLEALDDDLRSPTLNFRFREAAERYRLIPDTQSPVLVPFDAAAQRIRDQFLRGGELDFRVLRAAQPYLVNVWSHELRALDEHGMGVSDPSGIFVLTRDEAYTEETGLAVPGPELELLQT